jgi:indolepyruvate ferredoxin oxidoreductase beta subunit
MGISQYPKQEDILAKLKKVTDRVIVLDATKLAGEAGNLQSANVVMMGALFGSELVPINIATARAVIKARFPAKAATTNLKAFDLGYEVVQKVLKGAAEPAG